MNCAGECGDAGAGDGKRSQRTGRQAHRAVEGSGARAGIEGEISRPRAFQDITAQGHPTAARRHAGGRGIEREISGIALCPRGGDACARQGDSLGAQQVQRRQRRDAADRTADGNIAIHGIDRQGAAAVDRAVYGDGAAAIRDGGITCCTIGARQAGGDQAGGRKTIGRAAGTGIAAAPCPFIDKEDRGVGRAAGQAAAAAARTAAIVYCAAGTIARMGPIAASETTDIAGSTLARAKAGTGRVVTRTATAAGAAGKQQAGAEGGRSSAAENRGGTTTRTAAGITARTGIAARTARSQTKSVGPPRCAAGIRDAVAAVHTGAARREIEMLTSGDVKGCNNPARPPGVAAGIAAIIAALPARAAHQNSGYRGDAGGNNKVCIIDIGMGDAAGQRHVRQQADIAVQRHVGPGRHIRTKADPCRRVQDQASDRDGRIDDDRRSSGQGQPVAAAGGDRCIDIDIARPGAGGALRAIVDGGGDDDIGIGQRIHQHGRRRRVDRIVIGIYQPGSALAPGRGGGNFRIGAHGEMAGRCFNKAAITALAAALDADAAIKVRLAGVIGNVGDHNNAAPKARGTGCGVGLDAAGVRHAVRAIQDNTAAVTDQACGLQIAGILHHATLQVVCCLRRQQDQPAGCEHRIAVLHQRRDLAFGHGNAGQDVALVEVQGDGLARRHHHRLGGDHALVADLRRQQGDIAAQAVQVAGIFDAGGRAIALENSLAGHEIVEADAMGGGDQTTDIHAGARRKVDAVGVAEKDLAWRIDLAENLTGIGVLHPVESRTGAGGLIEIDLRSASNIEALPIQSRAIAGLVDVEGRALLHNRSLSRRHDAAGGKLRRRDLRQERSRKCHSNRCDRYDQATRHPPENKATIKATIIGQVQLRPIRVISR